MVKGWYRLVSEGDTHMPRTMKTSVGVLTGLLLWMQGGPAFGTEASVTQPAVPDDSLVFEVTSVEGRVRVAPSGTDILRDEGWTLLKLGDFIRAGQQVRVPVRSRVKLTARPAEPPTVLLIESSSTVNFSELALREGVARQRLQISYGAVKAGVAEGEVRSDMEIESPTATLSKKGTDIFGFEVQADGRFTMFLSPQGRGLVQGILNQAGGFGSSKVQSRFLTPGQWISQQMMRAIENMPFDQKVLVSDPYGLVGADQLFALLNDRGGISFLLPAGSSPWNILGGPSQRDGLTTTPQTSPTDPIQNLTSSLFGTGSGQPRALPGGDFGIGQGVLPGIFGPPRRINPLREIITNANPNRSNQKMGMAFRRR